jgi:hypothetical protein
LPDHLEFVKYFISVRSILELISQILTGPMFIVLASLPKPGDGHVVNKIIEGNPDFRFVLSVSQCQLRFCNEGKFFWWKQFYSFLFLQIALEMMQDLDGIPMDQK